LQLKAAGGEVQLQNRSGGSVKEGISKLKPPATSNYAGLSPQKVVSFFDDFVVVHQNLGEM
jgi:hypothetical protein